jgi:iron complex transport system permease protein
MESLTLRSVAIVSQTEILFNRNHWRRIWTVLLFTMALLIAVVVSICLGTTRFGLQDLLSICTGQIASGTMPQVIQNIRLPRILTGIAVGVNLAIAGALLQGLLRNPLASPQVIGVNSGAGLMAVLIMLVFPGMINLLPLGAFLGALLAAILIYMLASKQRSGVTTNIILSGMALSALLHAATSALMLLYGDELQVTFTWLIGGLTGRGWSYFYTIVPYCVVGAIAAIIISPKLNLFVLGEEIGGALGLSVSFYRMVIITLAAFLAGSAVSVAGTIAFMGLIAPHLARLLVGNDYRYLIPLSAVLGALLIVVADTLARTAFQPVELPVGILTAALGAPFFFYLIYRRQASTEV